MKNQDVSDWSVDDVVVWLKANILFEPYVETFTENEIDGYSLLNLTEKDMVDTLGMTSGDLRGQLKRAVKKLIVVWIRYGKNCESFFREQADSLYFDECSLIDQSLNESASSFSIVKMFERQGSANNMQHNRTMTADDEVAEDRETSRLIQDKLNETVQG